MRIIIGAPEELYAKIAAEFAAAAEKNPSGAFAFTAVDVPAGALEAIAASGADFSAAQAFNACEYVGEAAAGEHSQAAALNAALYVQMPDMPDSFSLFKHRQHSHMNRLPSTFVFRSHCILFGSLLSFPRVRSFLFPARGILLLRRSQYDPRA